MKYLTAAAVAVLLSTSVYAQQGPGTDSTSPSTMPQSRPAGNEGQFPPAMHNAANSENHNTTAGNANHFQTNQGQGQWLVGNLWDKSVYNAAGKSIGELKDVLIDKDGKVTALVVGVGGFLGLGEKNVAVDYNFLQQNGGVTPTRITLGMSEDDLRNAPKFERSSSSSSR
jgi:sporulation protein YlmC with PRC-barrel domain